MQFEQQTSAKQMQTMQLNTHMLDSLKILSLPVAELKERIDAELDANPALERVHDTSAVSLEEAFEKFDDLEYKRESEEWADTSIITAKKELIGVIEHTAVSDKQNLHETLLRQLGFQQITAKEREYARAIINNLDDNGFHSTDLDQHPSLSECENVAALVSLIQTFEPWGACVSGVQESLIVQARLYDNAPPHTDTILREHFVELEKRKFTGIANAMDIAEAEVSRVYKYVRTLTPYPGQTFGTQRAPYITPDIEILFKNHTYLITINEQAYPQLRINNLFLAIGTDEHDEKNQFVKSYRQQAQIFITALKRRNQTLLRTAYALLHKQHRFFRLGPRHIQPLRLRDIARTLQLHETTISRIASQKYMQTNWGIYPISYLFSGRIPSQATSTAHSKESVKAMIKDMLVEPGHPSLLSDQQVTTRLMQSGIQIARRTVTKYRNELDIPSTAYREHKSTA